MWTFFICWLILTNIVRSEIEECSTNLKSKTTEIIERNADLYIGSLLNLRNNGSEGIYGCGNMSQEGLIKIEAIKWIISNINQENGLISDKQVIDSFIPGIKLGVKIHDSCEHQELGLKYLTQMFSQLEDKKSECVATFIGNNQSSPLGILDSTDIHLNSRVNQILKKNCIPIAPLNVESFINSETIGKLLVKLIDFLQWTQLSIVYTNEESSIYIVKQIGQLGMNKNICLISVEPLPVVSEVGKIKESQIKSYNLLLHSITSELPSKSPIIIIGSGNSVNTFAKVLKENIHIVSKFQWLFSSMLSPKVIMSLDFMIDKILTFSPYPGIINDLENFWKIESNVNQSADNRFNLLKKDCEYSDCFKSLELNVLWRTYQSMPIIHSLFTFAHAIRNAWIDVCNGVRGLCKNLQNMTRKKFVTNFLENLNFEYNPSLRSPLELKGRKNTPLKDGEVGHIFNFALTTFTLTPSRIIKPTQVIAYLSSNDEFLVLNKNHHITPSPCTINSCKKCIKIRQSRFEKPIQNNDEDIYTNNELNFVTINENSANIYIPLIFEIHKKGKIELECSEELNFPAIYDLEAALWTLDQLNKEQSRGIKYGLFVIDSCSSILKITQKLTNFFTSKVNKKLGSISIQDTLSFISSLPVDQSQNVIQLLKPLNVSLISTQDLTLLNIPLGSDHYLFQTAISYKTFIDATIEQLKYFGWSYVSLVTLKGSKSIDVMHKSFIEKARETGICIATVATLEKNDLLTSSQNSLIKLKHAKVAGARVVIIIGDTLTTRAFISIFKKFTEVGSLKRGEFVWIVISESNLNIVSGLEEEFLGMLAIRESQANIKRFIDYFATLNLETNTRNPWFSKFLEQSANCQTHECNAKLMNPISAMNTMQSLKSLITSFEQLRDEICGLKEKGVCFQLWSNPNLRHLISKYINLEPTNIKDRFKNGKEKLSFTKDGLGEKTLDILNFKKDPKNGHFRFEKVAMFKPKFEKLDANNYVFYNENEEEIPMNTIRSDCTIPEVCIEQCPKNDLDYLVFKSPNNLYIAAAISIHQPSSLNPFQCGPIDYQGLQLVEAFLWALDNINRQTQILPNIKLGAIIIDTCGSHQKTGRDISNLLSNHYKSNLFTNNLPNSENILTLIINSNQVKIIDTVLDITDPFELITLATTASNSKYDEYPHLIRFSVSNQVYSDTLVSLLIYYQWTYASVVFKNDQEFFENIFEDFKTKSNIAGIEIGVQEKMNEIYSPLLIRLLLTRLNEGAKFGAKVIILLIDDDQLSSLLNEAKGMQDSGQINWKQFLIIAINGREAFQKYPEISLGALSIMKPMETISGFKDYFVNLNIRNNSRNPWFKEYLQSINNCFGTACFLKLDKKYINQSYINDPNIAFIINSVFTFVKGLSAAQQTVCPTQSYRNCPELGQVSKSGPLLSDLIKSSVFISGSGKKIKFLDNSNYVLEDLHIYNFRHVSSNTVAFLNVGRFNEKDGLFINTTKARVYDGLNFEKDLKQIISKCQGYPNCMPKRTQILPADSNIFSFTEYPTSNRFIIGTLLSIHKNGNSLFKCGEIDTGSMFQNLIAFNYALELVNNNKSFNDIKFGGLVIDICGRKNRAEEKLLNYFSKNNEEKIPSKSLIAMISYSQKVSQKIDPILSLHQITHLTIPSEKFQADFNFEEEIKAIRTIPKRLTLFEALLDLIEQLGWTYVHLVYNNQNDRNNFVSIAATRHICIAKEVDFSNAQNNVTYMINILKGNLSQSQEAQVVVNLLDDQLNSMLFSLTFQELIKKFVWVGEETMFNHLTSNKIMVTALTLKVESYTEKEFLKYMSSLTLGHYSPIPLNWFEEFWQSYFKCRLPNSVVSDNRFIKICSGKEQIEPNKLINDDFVHHTIFSVKAITLAVYKYLKLKCNKNALSSMDDCYKNIRHDLDQEIRKSFSKVKKDHYPENKSTAFGFHIILSISYKSFTNVGVWRNGLLQLFSEGTIKDSIGSSFISNCVKECLECDRKMNLAELVIEPKVINNYAQFWIILYTSLSGLGLLFVIIFTIYFSMIFSITYGTTILGYFILLGLFLIYLINFALLTSPTYTICCFRKIGMSLSYTIVISGMLVKVSNTWRLMAYRNVQAKKLKLTSSSGLLFIALGLVIFQTIITLTWLKISPPSVELINGQWTCSPINFNSLIETESIVSLTYIIFLIIITMFFAILTWKCADNNQESRYIFICCFGIFIVWICWAILNTYLKHLLLNYESNVICANLLSATIIMIGLYARKLRIYRKLIKRDRSLKARLDSSFSQSFYGSVHKSKSTFNPVLWGHQLDFYGNIRSSASRTATRAPFENDQIDDGASSCGSTTGSVQVQGEDLYPMEVYENGNQFKAVNPLFSSNSSKSLYVMDDSTFFK